MSHCKIRQVLVRYGGRVYRSVTTVCTVLILLAWSWARFTALPYSEPVTPISWVSTEIPLEYNRVSQCRQFSRSRFPNLIPRYHYSDKWFIGYLQIELSFLYPILSSCLIITYCFSRRNVTNWPKLNFRDRNVSLRHMRYTCKTRCEAFITKF
jgi:hypothetical protein